MEMYNPPHPGEILKEEVVGAAGITIDEAARQLRVSRVTLSRILNGKSAITAAMAIRLSVWLKTSPDVWMFIPFTGTITDDGIHLNEVES
jgi:addiction module HigA family antidote